MRPHDLLRAWLSWRAPGETWGELRPLSIRVQAREQDIDARTREPRLTAGLRAGMSDLTVRASTNVVAIGAPAPLLMRLMKNKHALVPVLGVRRATREAREAFPKLERSDRVLREVRAERAPLVRRGVIDGALRERVQTGLRARRGALAATDLEGAC